MNQNYTLNEFDRDYTAVEHKRDKDNARWFYRDKTPFETKHEQETVDGNETSWVSDKGRGEFEMISQVAYNIDGEDIDYNQTDRLHKIRIALQRVRRRCPTCEKTLMLIIKNGNERNKSICELMKS